MSETLRLQLTETIYLAVTLYGETRTTPEVDDWAYVDAAGRDVGARVSDLLADMVTREFTERGLDAFDGAIRRQLRSAA